MSDTKQIHDFEYKGFDCSVIEYSFGEKVASMHLSSLPNEWWCGYVMIPKGHKYFEKDYDEIDVSVHGGLTFGGGFHVAKSKNGGKFAIGFDFQHFNDYGGSKEEAITECKSVVDQLKEGKEV